MNTVNNKTLLLVEDEPLIAMAEQIELEKFGYTVFTAYSGEEAIQIFNEKKNHIDLILMDIDLGAGLDGTEAAEIILKEKEIPIVFLSSHTEPEIVEKTEDITSYGYVVKNSGITVLDASIKMAFKLFEANRAVKSREAEYKSTVDNLLVGVVVHAGDTSILFSNPEASNILGLSAEQIAGKEAADPAWSFVHEDSTPMKIEDYPVSKVIATKKPLNDYIAGIKRPDRDYTTWVDVHAVPIISSEGELENIIINFINITEHKQAEQKIEQLSQFRESIIDNANIWLNVLDENANVVVWNKAAEQISGYTREEVFGESNIWEWFYPDDEYRNEIISKAASIMSGQTVEDLETIITCKDGSAKTMSWHSRYLLDKEKKIIGSIALGLDITKRKRAEKELADTRILMDAIFEQSPIPMAVARMPDAVLVVVNPASRETLKLETDLVGKSLFTIALDWKTLTPDGREVAPENIPLARAIQGETILKELLQIVRKDGSTRWIEISAGPIYGKQGTQIAAQAAFPDITERKNAEEALAKALRENKILLRELQHRAKNSFAMLSGMIKLAERSSESHEEKTVLNEIGSRVRAVSELYDLLYSENSVTEVRLDTYFSRIAASLPRISKNITLNISCDTISATVKTAIPTGIIITELMTNSIKHAFPGNRSGSISLSLEKTGDGARIQVIDDGIGLPDGLDISTVNSMGLSVVRALVEQVSGSSRIERSNGTRCIVEFPIEENTEE